MSALLNKSKYVLIPVLFAVYPILLLYSENRAEVPSKWLWQSLLLGAVSAVIGFFLAYFSTKNPIKSSLIASIFWLFFYFYVPLVETASKPWPKLTDLDTVLLPAWFVLFAIVSGLILRSKRSFANIFKFTAIASGTMSLLLVGSIVASPGCGGGSCNYSHYLLNQEDKQLDGAGRNLPDIYYIVLDGYPRSDTLLEYYGFSNEEFDGSLENKGFRILGDSDSNYNRTVLSVPSSLNMSYMADGPQLTQAGLFDLFPNNSVSHYLSSAGYEITNNSNDYATTSNRYGTHDVVCSSTNTFLLELLDTTALKPLKVRVDETRMIKREDALCTIDHIKGHGDFNAGQPQFVFTHILQPHPPYIFDENGNDTSEINLSLTYSTTWLAKEPFISQLKYLNKLVLEQMNEILAKTKNSIIIIQSDHGTLSSATEASGLSDKRPVVLKERSRNYTAIYLPDYCDQSQLYDSITNVNTFRAVFNACFDAGFEILDDRIYYTAYQTKSDVLREFEDITDIVRDTDD